MSLSWKILRHSFLHTRTNLVTVKNLLERNQAEQMCLETQNSNCKDSMNVSKMNAVIRLLRFGERQPIVDS